MQDTYKTLKDEDTNNIVSQVVEVLKNKFKATLR